jgi:hypothetical protein
VIYVCENIQDFVQKGQLNITLSESDVELEPIFGGHIKQTVELMLELMSVDTCPAVTAVSIQFAIFVPSRFASIMVNLAAKRETTEYRRRSKPHLERIASKCVLKVFRVRVDKPILESQVSA